MPTIQITNDSSLDLSASTADGNAAINKYLKNVLTLKAPVELDTLVNLKVSDVPTASFPVQVSAAADTEFDLGTSTLEVHPGASAAIGLLNRAGMTAFLQGLDIGPDPSAGGLVSLGIGATVTVNDSGSTGDVALGLTKTSGVTVTSYVQSRGDARFTDALKTAAQSLAIPRDLDDLAALPPGAVCQVEGNSSLQFSASFRYSFLNNPLATVAVAKLPAFAVNASASATLKATATHEADHSYTVARLPNGKLRMSVDLTKSDDFETSLTLTAGATAGVEDYDALELLLGKISPDTKQEAKQIAASLPPDRASKLSAEIKAAIEASLSSSLKVSLKGAIDLSRSRNRLLLFEVDPAATGDEGKAALRAALRGDFRKLTASTTPAGIQVLDSALTVTTSLTHTFAVHLLGIYNYRDANSFVQTMQVDYTKDTHELVLSDESIAVLTGGLRADKLRQVALKGMTLTLPASANTPEAVTPITLVFYDRQANLHGSRLHQFSNVLAALDSPDAAAAWSLTTRTGGESGSGSLYLGLDLTPGQCKRLFLDEGGRAREWMSYVSSVCAAERTILEGDADNVERLKLFRAPADVWKRLQDAGSRPAIVAVLKDIGVSELAVPDVLTIVWWSEAMADYAKALASRLDLVAVGRKVVKDSALGFSEPWLLLAVWDIAGRPEVRTVFTSPLLKPAMAARG